MKAKTLAALTGLLLTLPALGQDMTMPIPPELKSVEYMLGHWEGDMTMTMGPGVETKFKATIDCEKILGGRYLRAMHKYGAEGGVELSGMLILTYDGQAKNWISWWLDSTAPGMLEMTGQMDGGAVAMTSKPTPMAGLGDVVTRSTWTKVSATELKLKLEMQQDKQWVVFMQADYKKK